MEQIRILIADDEKEIRTIASRALRSQGFETIECGDGLTAYRVIREQSFDAVLLDVNMDGMDGFHILQAIREQGIETPVLIITGNDEEYNEVFGFSIGADDYIIKPFRPSALTARVKALLKRSRQYSDTASTLKAGPFQMVCQNYTFFKDGKELTLTPKERQLMHFFMRHVNHVFSKEQLYSAVWKELYVDDNTIMVTIRNLRHKIEEDPKNPRFLVTVYGLGYKFVVS